jgi:hypothetical protein
MGSLYRSRHEFVFVFKSGTAPHINNVELGKYATAPMSGIARASMASAGTAAI